MGTSKASKCQAAALALVVASALVLGKAQQADSWLHMFLHGLFSILLLLLALMILDISRMSPADSHSVTTLALQYVLYRLMVMAGGKVYRRLIDICNNISESQESLLLEIIKKNSECEYGKNHNFRAITCYIDFIEQVPLSKYDNYQQQIDRVEKGEQGILTKDKVVFLATTSGTTGTNKLIPITTHMKGSAAYKVGPLMYYIMDQKAGLSLQRVCVLSHKSVSQTASCGLPKGPVSSHMSRYLPFVMAPPEAFDIENEQIAMYVHAIFNLREREVGHIEALVSSLVFTFWMCVHRNWESICDAIEQGCIKADNVGDLTLAKKLSGHLKADPKRSEELRKIFKFYKHAQWVGVAKKVWPGLRFVRMLNTGGFAHHAEILKKTYMADVIQISQTHVASEGFMGFNLSPDPGSCHYTAMADYAFLEFIPLADVDQPHAQTLLAEQVSKGECYEMVLTTPMGLYRYRTGDIVKIVSHQGQCPVYEFQYRYGQLLNLYWEKTPESVFYKAVENTVQDFEEGVTLVEFTSTEDACLCDALGTVQFSLDDHRASLTQKHYVLFIEVEKNGKSVILSEEQCDEFDDNLCQLMELYSDLRHSGSIATMQVVQLQTGTFQRLKNRIISETQNQQYKVPRVLRQPKFLQFLWSQRIHTIQRVIY